MLKAKLAHVKPLATQPPYLDGPQIQTNAQNKMDLRRAHRRFLAERINRQYTIRHFFRPSVPTPALIDPQIRVP
jgi:hypothetical protein